MKKEFETEMIETGDTLIEQPSKKINMLAGIVGAFLGSLLGVAAIVLIGQMGFIASIAGVILAVCTFKGYEMFGDELNKTSIVVCVIIMIVMVYVGCQLDWALSITQELNKVGSGIDIFTSFRSVPLWLKEGNLDAVEYFKSLAMLYLFLAIGVWSSISKAVNK